MNNENYTKDELIEMFHYLDNLRDSGEINMCAAWGHLMEMFDIKQKVSRQILGDWMITFDEDVSVEDRIKEDDK